jgi:hypothetical protein
VHTPHQRYIIIFSNDKIFKNINFKKIKKAILEDLNKKQESQLKKLNLIGEKLNKFCEQFDLNLNINDKNTNATASQATPLAIEKSTIKWDEKVFENLTRPETKQDVCVSFFLNQIFSFHILIYYRFQERKFRSRRLGYSCGPKLCACFTF